MAHGIINVTRSNPCPICGKPDWCGWMPPTNPDDEMCLVCQRDTVKKNQIGYDGKHYVYLAESQGGNSVYMELNAYEQKEKRWEAQYGKKSHKERNFRKAADYQQYAPRSLQPVNIIEPKRPVELDPLYRYMTAQLKLLDMHRNYLHSQGWTDEMIRTYGVVSFPESDSLRRKFKRRSENPERRELAKKIMDRFGEHALEGVPGAYRVDGEWNFFGPSGILFPMYDISGNLYRLRIRMDFRDQKEEIYRGISGLDDYMVKGVTRYYICMKGIYTMENREKKWSDTRGKYRTLSSYMEDDEERKKGFLKNRLDGGCRSGNVISCYRPKEHDPSAIIVTEGEPKGAYTAMKLGMEVWTLPGVNSYGLLLEEEKIDFLKRNNKTMLIAFDADKQTNANVLKMENDLIKGLLENEIPVMKLEWDINAGKGIDDNLAAGGGIRFVPVEQ